VKFDLDHSTGDARRNGGRRQHVYLTLAPSALRANAKSMSEMSGGMMGASQAAMLPEKLALRELQQRRRDAGSEPGNNGHRLCWVMSPLSHSPGTESRARGGGGRVRRRAVT
jgi:hypothetical protein